METDKWGNILIAPIKTIDEKHGDNFIRVFIYENAGVFYFGYQLKLNTVVKQKAANINDLSFNTAEAARIAACKAIQTIGNANRISRAVFADFIKTRYHDQRELFEEDTYGFSYTNGN